MKFDNFDEQDMEKFLEEMINQIDFDKLDELELENLMNEMASNDYSAFYNFFSEEMATHMLVMDSIEEVLEDYNLSKIPTTNRLHDCLNAYTKEVLFTLGEDNGLPMKKSSKKAQMVQTLEDHILNTLPERIVLLGNRQRELLEKAILGDFNMDNMHMEDVNFFVEVLPVAIKLGLIVARLDDFGQLQIFATTECIEAIEDIRSHQKDVKQHLKLYRELNKVLKAAINLYGAIHLERFYALWDILYPDFKYTDEFYDTIRIIFPILIIQNGYHFVNREIIGSSEFEYNEDVALFYFETELKLKDNYYKPTKRDIRYYAKNTFDRETKEYRNLRQAVRKISDVPDMALDVIESGLRFGALPSSVFEELQELELIELDSIDEIEPFLNCYMQMNNETRMWVNAGYKPGELKH